MMFNSIQDAWKYGVESILRRGNVVEDERGDKTMELLNLMMGISTPFVFDVINYPVKTGLWSNKEALTPYIDEFLKGDCKGFVYTYGNRLHEYFDIDQIDSIVERLKNCRESRRATAVTWYPPTDTSNEDVPCLIMVDFKIRGNHLFTTGVWRSHDIFQAYYPNLVGLSYLSKDIAERTGVKVGTITTHSISAHIREADFEQAESLILR